MSYIRYDARLCVALTCSLYDLWQIGIFCNHFPVFTHPMSASESQAAEVLASPTFSPLYQQIKAMLVKQLQAGEWRPGELIPSEMELAARFRVSQGTVRKAIDEMAAENLVMRRQGRGTFVATHSAKQVQYRFLRLFPDQGDLEAEGRAQRVVHQCRRVRAPAAVGKALRLSTGAPVIHVQRVLSFANIPTIAEDIWLPGQPFKGLTAERLTACAGPTYAMFEAEFGVQMVRADEKIRAVLADAAQMKLLEIQAHTPLLSVERVAYTYNDVPMELRHGFYRTDTHHYRNTLS